MQYTRRDFIGRAGKIGAGIAAGFDSSYLFSNGVQEPTPPKSPTGLRTEPAQAEKVPKAPQTFADLLDDYKCDFPIYFDAGGRNVGQIVRDNKIRIKVYELRNADAKTAFLEKPDPDYQTTKQSTYINEFLTKGNAPYGTSSVDGYRGLTKKSANEWTFRQYIGGSDLSSAKDEYTGKDVVAMFNSLYDSAIVPAIMSCKKIPDKKDNKNDDKK